MKIQNYREMGPFSDTQITLTSSKVTSCDLSTLGSKKKKKKIIDCQEKETSMWSGYDLSVWEKNVDIKNHINQ